MLISLLLSSPLYLSLWGNLALYNSSSIRQQARAAIDALHICGKPVSHLFCKMFVYCRCMCLEFIFNCYVYKLSVNVIYCRYKYLFH